MRTSSSSRFVLQKHEKTEEGFVRILHALAENARSVADDAKNNVAESVHALRKLIKRTRALLWYVTPALSDDDVCLFKDRLRRIAHALSRGRNPSVLRATLGQVCHGCGKRSRREACDAVDKIAVAPPKEKMKRHVLRASRELGELLHNLATNLKSAPDASSMSGRLRKARRACSKAARSAGKKGSDRDLRLHDWRKKVKRLLYLYQTFEHAKALPSKKLKQLDKLQDTLGDYHDMAEAQKWLSSPEAKPLRQPAIEQLKCALEKQKKRLRKKIKRR